MILQNTRNFFAIDFSRDRIYGLDILRAAAILVVVWAHGHHFLPKEFHIIYQIFRFDGVTLFFVLSGFLIGRILIKTVEKNVIDGNALLHFWKRRWFRTLPNYYLVLLFLLFHHSITKDFSIVDNLHYLVFSQNLFYSHPWFFGEAWSLSVEEWFYVLIPILLFISIKYFKFFPKNSFLFVLCFTTLFALLFRMGKYYYLGSLGIDDFDTGKEFTMQVLTRLDSIMYGILGAYAQHYYSKFWIKYKKTLLLLGVILIITVQFLDIFIDQHAFYSCVISYSLASFSFLCLLPFFSNLKTGEGRLYRVITVMSLISYSMYLLNLNVVFWIIIQNISWYVLPLDAFYLGFVKFFAFWIVTILLSIVVYKYYEIPMTALRDKKTIHT